RTRFDRRQLIDAYQRQCGRLTAHCRSELGTCHVQSSDLRLPNAPGRSPTGLRKMSQVRHELAARRHQLRNAATHDEQSRTPPRLAGVRLQPLARARRSVELEGWSYAMHRVLAVGTVCFALMTVGVSAQTSQPYAGLQTRPIKALSEQQIADLRTGRGMSLALAAELNGYPGPRHVLELADQLDLSSQQ